MTETFDIEIDDELVSQLESIGHNAQLITSVPAAQLKKRLQTGGEDPAYYYAIMNRHAMMMALDTHYYTYYELSKRK